MAAFDDDAIIGGDDTLLKMAASPLVGAGLGLVQGSAPTQGAANPFAGLASGLQSSLNTRMQLALPVIQARINERRRGRERAQALEDAKSLAQFRANLPSEGAPSTLGKDEQHLENVLADPTSTPDQIARARQRVAVTAAGGRDRPDSTAEAIRAVMEGQAAKSEAAAIGKRRDEFNERVGAFRGFVKIGERYKDLVRDNPQILTAVGRNIPSALKRLSNEAQSAVALVGGVGGDIPTFEEFSKDKSIWDELPGATIRQRRMIYDLALTWTAAAGMGQGRDIAEKEFERAMNTFKSYSSAEGVLEDLDTAYQGLADRLEGAASTLPGVSFDRESELPQPAPDPVLTSFQQSFPDAPALPNNQGEASALGMPVADNIEILNGMNLPEGTWAWVRDDGTGRSALVQNVGP